MGSDNAFVRAWEVDVDAKHGSIAGARDIVRDRLKLLTTNSACTFNLGR